MGKEIPREVRAGEVISAAWLNSIISYLRYLNEQQLRRRILRGVGYQAKESAGGTSLTIDRQAIVRAISDDLDILRNQEFRLRIKPQNECRVDEESGDWDKVLQVHTGRVTDHLGHEITVTALEQDDENTQATPSPGTESTVWDAGEWVDVGILSPASDSTSGEAAPQAAEATEPGAGGASDEEGSINVYVRLTLSGTVPQQAVFAVEKKEDTQDLYIPIGKARAEVVSEFLRIYINQYQEGPIELGGVVPAMPFDVNMTSAPGEPGGSGGDFVEPGGSGDYTEPGGVFQLVSRGEPEPGGEESEEVYYLSIESGRVFLPEREFVEIPRKDKLQLTDPGSTRYVTLTLTRSGAGQYTYAYTLEAESALGTKRLATEKAPS